MLFTAGLNNAYSQRVGINILIPDSSALLHLESEELGFLPPRMTTQQRDSIANPAIGLIIYNTLDSTIQYFNGECWLSVFQQNCGDCIFSLTASSIADTIDRVIADSVSFTLTINQSGGTPQNIAFAIIGQLPLGMTGDIVPNPQFSSGTATVTIKVTPFTPAGTYPIVIQVMCGTSIHNFIYSLTVLPCYILQVNNSQNNYNMGTHLYATFPTAPTNSPVCVVSQVHAGIEITSTASTLPAFTTGNLPAGSYVAIVNNGNIIGKGGNGGIAEDPSLNVRPEGDSAGHAIFLTIDAHILNNFNIYGGGGGGSAMAFGFGFPIGPIFLGFLIGAGGGGGAGGSLGGNLPTVIGLVFYSPGINGTGGQFGVAGQGGILNFPINFQQGPVSISLNPNAVGGNGGEYGYPGTQGAFNLTISASMVITIPIIGPVTIPLITNLNVPIPVPIPPPGEAGFAIKRNGFITNIPDNNYNTSFLKGRVGP